MNLSIVMPSLWEFLMRECSAIPTVLVRAPWVFCVDDEAYVEGGVV